jgi:carbon-monoxide dehydrogenase large subunit
MGGNAVMQQAQKLRERFRELAAQHFNVEAEAIRISADVALTEDGRSVTMAELAHLGIACEGKFTNSTATYTYGSAAAHVTVDVQTGRVQVLDYVVCDDVGRIINHLTLHGQVMGAVVQGFGSVFGEELVYDDNGTLLIGTLAEYFAPLSTDYPQIRCVSLESYPSPTNPMGAKGAGEGGVIPVGGVVANAVASALRDFGVRPNHLPLSPYRVWQMIQDSSKPA